MCVRHGLRPATKKPNPLKRPHKLYDFTQVPRSKYLLVKQLLKYTEALEAGRVHGRPNHLAYIVPHGCGLACIVDHVVPMLATRAALLWPKAAATDLRGLTARTNNVDLRSKEVI